MRLGTGPFSGTKHIRKKNRWITDIRSPPVTYGNIRQHLRMRISLYAVIDAISANDKFEIENNVWGRWGRWIVGGKVEWRGRKTAKGKHSSAEGETILWKGKKSEGKGPKIGGCLRRKKKPAVE